MKKLLFAVLLTLFAAQPALAVNYGPASNAVPGGHVTLGVGASDSTTKWEGKSNSILPELKTKQQIGYVELGLGLGGSWKAYVRGGGTYIEGDNLFQSTSTSAEETLPLASVGMSGLFYDGRVLNIGPFIQGTYYFMDLEDNATGSVDFIADGLGNPVPVSEDVLLTDFWTASGGLTAELEIEGALLYGGVMYYDSKASYTSTIVDLTSGQRAVVSQDIDEEDSVGSFVGLRWLLHNGVIVEIEAEKRSSGSVGMKIAYGF